ncbi:Nn.00g075300.m01.CDS01 [Neocucurbitaria sp. VM-36]
MALIGDSELNASSFCTRCRELLWRPQDSRDLHTIHNISEADLMASVQDNCRICRTLWSTADKISMDWTFKTSGSIPRLLWKHKDFVTIEYEREQFQLRPLLTMDDSPIISPLANTTASDATWSMISKWFSNCTTNHTKCERTPSKLRHLPTRLIDIGDLGSHNVRLVITRQLPDSATTELQYFTLSHRWGTGSPVKLLNENLQQFLLSIPWTSFSHTFQDAMTVTKKFGFRYIWIGSLCIIQNNAEDWLKESATMSDVYEGGICNIAATAAGETGTDGLFAKRDGTTIAPFMLDIARKGSVDRYLCSRNAFRYDGYLKSLLSRRGWVFQERLLSPRTLHFNQQVFWECKEIECAESYPMGLNDGQFIRDPGSGLKYEFVLPQKSWLEDIRTSPQRRYEIWQELVHGYTCCELSEEKDKLVAISGLVKKLQPVMNDEYICGLWRSDLLNGLTWWVEYSSKANGSPSFRPKQYRESSKLVLGFG